MQLNGWQRIGVLLSIGWLIFILFVLFLESMDTRKSLIFLHLDGHSKSFQAWFDDQDHKGRDYSSAFKIAGYLEDYDVSKTLSQHRIKKQSQKRLVPIEEAGLSSRSLALPFSYNALIEAYARDEGIYRIYWLPSAKSPGIIPSIFVPIISSWIVAYTVLYLIRWVVKGFKITRK